MTTRTLQKWHGAGNDFLVEIDDGSMAGYWTPELAAAVCDRRLGVGADGLLVATPAGSDVLEMLLYNADGSLAEMSGNGARCLVAGHLRSLTAHEGSVVLSTAAGPRRVSMRLTGGDGYGEVEMGPVSVGSGPEGTLGVARVGNPHVSLLDRAEWSDAEREQLAARLAEPLGGANVGFVVPEGEGRLGLRVLERGVGWTLACGTGSVAAAALAHAAGLCGRAVQVENPGGVLAVVLDEGGSARLAGPVRFVADVEWAGH